MRASHILVKTEGEAKNILERLRKGEDFAKIAQKSSIDTGSAKNGGDLGYFSQGQMVPEFEAAAARLKIGEISEPVKSRFGFHIIKVTDKKMGKPLEFDKIKNNIYQRVVAERQKEFFDNYVEDLKKRYKVEINKEAIAKLTEEPAGQEGSEEQKPVEKEQGKEKGETSGK
jgi:parvulin-like peptidyl-prolyl isomerase